MVRVCVRVRVGACARALLCFYEQVGGACVCAYACV